MKTILYVIIFLNIYSNMYSQEHIKLKYKDKKIENIVPHNWYIIDSTTLGDLNNDGINDLVIVIKKKDPKNVLTNSEIGNDSIDINPRILAIYFKNKNSCLKKQLQNNNFIYVNRNPTIEEPFQGISIAPEGGLQIDFQLFYNAGSWYTYNESYFFKYKNDSFELIKYSKLAVNRATMESEEEKVNFLKGETTYTTETFKEEDKDKEYPIVKSTRTTFVPEKLQLLKEVKTPFLFIK